MIDYSPHHSLYVSCLSTCLVIFDRLLNIVNFTLLSAGYFCGLYDLLSRSRAVLSLGLFTPHYWSQILLEYAAQSLVPFSSLTAGKRPWARFPPGVLACFRSLWDHGVSVTVFHCLVSNSFENCCFVCFVWFCCSGGGYFWWEGKSCPCSSTLRRSRDLGVCVSKSSSGDAGGSQVRAIL